MSRAPGPRKPVASCGAVCVRRVMSRSPKSCSCHVYMVSYHTDLAGVIGVPHGVFLLFSFVAAGCCPYKPWLCVGCYTAVRGSVDHA